MDTKNKAVSQIAIIGNPNVGKSTIFNYLTGLNQKIGNYPGVTVDKKTGTIQIKEKILKSLTYQELTAYSQIQRTKSLHIGY